MMDIDLSPTMNELENALNLLLFLGSGIASIIFVFYYKNAVRATEDKNDPDYEYLLSARCITFAIALGMFGSAIVAGPLVLLYWAQAAELPNLETFVRQDLNVVSIANVGKGIVGFAAFLHLRVLIRNKFNKWWPVVVFVIVSLIFVAGTYLPRLT